MVPLPRDGSAGSQPYADRVDGQLVRVLASGELPESTAGDARIRRIDVAGTDVLLGRLAGGRVVAFAATCPHQRTDLGGATFFDGLVRCPLHLYLYEPGTGENVVPARDADPANLWKLAPGYLPVYPVEERDGWIWVGSRPKPPPRSYDPAVERRPPAGGRESRPAPAPTAASPVEHPTKVLRVAPGATFELRLATTPRPGFVWRVDTGGPLLAVVEERFDPVGRPRHLIRLAARGEGRTTVRCEYARPWEKDALEVRTYDVEVTLG